MFLVSNIVNGVKGGVTSALKGATDVTGSDVGSVREVNVDT